jgi:FkbM family methyltransferase
MFLPLFFKHPLTKENPFKAIIRYGKWHLLKLIGKGYITHSLIGETKVHLGKNDSAALVNYYTGLYEFEEMCFLLHFLRKQDLMIDVGANIGVFSLLASGHVGCKSIAFEPIPSTFQRLIKNIKLNGLENKITPLNIGLGSSNSVLKFTNHTENSINRVADTNDKNAISVDVKKLDDITGDLNSFQAILLKVDVEGFETEVLRGADEVLANPLLKAIIIELNGSGNKFGFDEKSIKEKLQHEGFELFYYKPFDRSVSNENPTNNWGNTIFIRDIEFVKERVHYGNDINILGKLI